MAACRDCDASIRFVRIVNTGRMMPVDPVTDDRGNVWAWQRNQDNWDALVLAPGVIPRAGERPVLGPVMTTPLVPRADAKPFMPHAATCPARSRPKQRRPKPRTEDTLF